MTSHGNRKAHRERKKAIIARKVMLLQRMEKALRDIAAFAGTVKLHFSAHDNISSDAAASLSIVEDKAREGLRKEGF